MNKSIFVSIGIVSLLYAFLIGGYLILLYPAIQRLKGIFIVKKRLRMSEQKQNKSAVYKHLDQLLVTTRLKAFNPYSFLIFSILLSIVLLYLGIQNFSGMVVLLLSIFGGVLPYGLLRIRLEGMRHKGSFEGEKVISEFLRQYRICNYNVHETLEQIIGHLEHSKISQRLFFQILIRLRNTGNPELIREACDLYYFGIHTNWSRMLATNLRMASEKGVNISLAVEDILIQLRDARSASEERRRMNSEATRMTVFMVPILYVSTIFLSCRYMDLPFSNFCVNQFNTSQGLLFFLFIWFSFLFNLLVLDFFNHHRFDC
ncbi:hypothetical protein [Sinanaerobacter sp. ZZT-01]|uniref:hypothetical protein n=1 Tax=Sinanaerobacter sp. ZZT-01 TaxID=3111540 RepID=UPI002D76CF21|nr:hypothetical protein [Sinanaerobacter sp. ZZT-01]WRR92792.1 hypothetical protein U5921_12230 [Sinanaerobacter sp. ZZT-01]